MKIMSKSFIDSLTLYITCLKTLQRHAQMQTGKKYFDFNYLLMEIEFND